MSMETIFAVLCFVYLMLMSAKVLMAFVYAAGDPASDVSGLEKGSLTVAQAILSGDDGLETMLASNLVSLTGQRFLWLCDEDDEVAISVTRKLIDRFPHEAIEVLLCPPCPPCQNPKVFKLIRAARRAETPFFLVLDDDTHLPAQTAATLVHHALTNGIATGLPNYWNGSNSASRLLAQFVNNNSAMTYLSTLPVMPPISINGMCYVMKTADTDVFPKILNHLTDDLALASVVRQARGTIYQSSHPQQVATSVSDFPHYVRFMHRWYVFASLLLKEQSLWCQLGIFVLHGWHPLLLWAMVVMTTFAFSWPLTALLAGILTVRAMLLMGLHLRLFRQNSHSPLTSIVSELLQPFHLVHALVSRDIIWRSRRYRVYRSDHFEDHE